MQDSVNLLGEEHAQSFLQRLDNRLAPFRDLTVGDCYVQCFDKNCKVDTDLQSILPGANDMEIIGEYVYLASDSQTVILKEKEVVIKNSLFIMW